ncbi:MAG: tRNA (adenosine(37)-N6)-threonylcarbamoyltransferase complex dimerization subunit type 1 TsaB [Candidatus Rokubacteria bacterium]|nr:tRNA (adenosine(37)-N6)-threonylcarbamoyltransferase complex dimerization subunit type 1 TsaB [Candidatus Rokubacteria bacterium]
MRVLGIDTCGPQASVALVEGDAILAEERLPAGSRASRETLPAVERVLVAAGAGIDGVGAFAAVRGPGSFTGLRVGLATARGLALAAGRPAAGFCALDLLARQVGPGAGALCALIDAGRGELYAGLYLRAASGWERAGEWLLLEPRALLEKARGAVLVGPGAERIRALLEERGEAAAIAPHRPWLAADAARLLARRLEAGEAPDPESLRPLYIRPSEAERTGRWRTTPFASTA